MAGGGGLPCHGLHDIEARGALVAGRLETVSDRIQLDGAVHADGGIALLLPSPKVDDAGQKRLPVVVIGPGVAVDGPVTARRGGTLWVSRQARIGAVESIAVRWLDGSAPPIPPSGS
ncbi:MAG: hypothetical protein EPN78_05465 [Rhodanobacter sp.]|nr:MAG: hypothetical protein EPN78_05465 [Rhodanobacter sp.]TAM13518.1 MAG: hypothetical protein EPN66_04395 [Rhodanobacter sp.]